jgi:outer membrane receptor protein involved in Fe transport
MMKKLLRLATFALLFTGVASAQTTGSITGVVTDGSSGQPVIGAVVVATSPAAPGEQSAVTDAKGAFTIANLPAGSYKLQASFEGYKTETRADLALGENVTLRANLAIVPEAVQMEEVVVTGSRIKRKDLTTAAPVTVVNREAVLASGKVSIGDFLQSMPEQGAAINTQFNNSGDGATRINLRSLGSGRTLVLMNGRRFVAGGTGADASVDLNSIPASAIERIEILKDGASAVYGSDAVAGVVNIITRKRYNGTEATIFTGTSGEGDGQIYDVNFTTGTGSEKGNILFNAGYYEQKTVWSGDRSWAQDAYIFDYTTNEAFKSGSSAIPMGRARVDLDDPACTSQTCVDLRAAGLTGPQTLIVDPAAPGGFRPYNGATDSYNFQPENYLVTPQKRVSLFASGDTNLGNVARGYFEASYVNRKSAQKLAPEPLFNVNLGIPISADSLYNPFGQDIGDARRRLVEFGNRDFTQDLTTFRVVTGLDGALGDWAGPLKGWNWDASYNFGRTQGVNTTNGTLRAPYIAAAIGPSMIDPATGAPICVGTPGDATTAIAGCVPLNLLGGAGTITPDQVAGLGFFGTDVGLNQQEAVSVSLGGDLFKLMADRPAGIAAGFDWRKETGYFKPNPISGSGENSGNNSGFTDGSYKVNEFYAEVVLPVLNNVPGVHDLELTAAIRFFDYTTFGSDNTYKVGARYSPVRDLTFRGTYSTAFRAPTIGALYSGQSESFPQVSDPCGVDQTTGLPRNPVGTPIGDLCVADGVTPGANGDDRTQMRSAVGGNPDLTPETAKIFTFGAVIEPRWVPNLTATVDFYSIDLTNSITDVGEGVIMAGCYPGVVGAARTFCDKVTRDPVTGVITSINNLTTNVGGDVTSGIDVALRYMIPTASAGQFRLAFDGTWLLQFDRTQANGDVIEAKGTFDLNPTLLPEFKANAGIQWNLGGLGAGLSARWVGSSKECANSDGISGQDGVCAGQTAPLSHTIAQWATFDAFVGYNLNTAAGNTAITVGAQNLLDEKPATAWNGFLASSDAATYDYMGRYVYARLTQAF